jgi:DNA-binding protein
MSDANVIYIGSKPPMSYVMAMIRSFNVLGSDDVVLKARGRAISRAVDVAEISRRRFLTGVETVKIEIGSEQMPMPEGGTRGVSTIAITMRKTEKPATPEKPSPPPLDVSEVKGVGGTRAEKLRKSGFSTVASLAKADPEKISKLTGISEKLSANLVESAKELMKKK